MDNTGRWSVGEMTDKFSKLDYMTQRTIMNEFPDFFGVWKVKIDTNSIDHMPERKFSMSEFFGGFGLVLAIIAILGKLLPYVAEWIF